MTAFLAMPAASSTPRRNPYRLEKSDCDALGSELDAIRRRVMADRGEGDVRYIKRLLKIQRATEISGRLALFLSFHPVAWCAGVLLLALSKILDNMEIGHNIMHGQYNWTHDPELRGKNFEWDNACPGEQWRRSHNHIHHTHTNILGKDRDVGYGILRMAEAQPWKARHLFQPVRAFLMMLIFEWGVAMHDLEMDRLRSGEVKWQHMRGRFWQSMRKMSWQGLKDYVVFPLLAFPIFLNVLLANLAANLIRNGWAFVIIFCGHFTDEVEMFTEEETWNESRGQWYVRQMLGSANISGSRLFHILSGHLSHQIEHHLFPDMPAHRYAEIGPEVCALCERYGLPYNTGPLSAQFFTVIKRIVRLSFPSSAPTRQPYAD